MASDLNIILIIRLFPLSMFKRRIIFLLNALHVLTCSGFVCFFLFSLKVTYWLFPMQFLVLLSFSDGELYVWIKGAVQFSVTS